MAVSNKITTWQFTAANDLTSTIKGTGSIFKAISGETGNFASNGRAAHGILYTSAKSGTHDGTYADAGKMKYTAGAAVSSQGTLLSVTTSGYVIPADSGAWIVGKSIGNDVSSGKVGIGHFNFSTPWFAVDCTWLGY
jgi:CDP-diglyceride synthetase